MLNYSKDDLRKIKKSFSNKKIAVVGDMMLDGYYWGEVARISPEAPVPVVEIEEEFFKFGGAANVALNVKSLGGFAYPVGILGEDQENEIFQNLLKKQNISNYGIVTSGKRPTTIKIRVIANKQHIVRIDKEVKHNISSLDEEQIIKRFKDIIDEVDAVIMQDYNKGVLTENIIKTIISMANDKHKLITVDPKFVNFFSYNDVTVFKPNRKETEDAFNMRIITENDINNAGEMLLKKIKSEYVLLTLGEKGISLFRKNKKPIRIPTRARKVADVSGAGDTVIATLTMAMSAGCEIGDAAYFANFAGGLVCEEMGIVPVDSVNLFKELEEDLI